jgi:hypothetical protein
MRIEEYFPMKVASMARTPQQPEEDLITTDDEFPPEEGRYTVSFDFDLLSAGYQIDSTHRDAAGELTYYCIPHDFSRCLVIATREHYIK